MAKALTKPADKPAKKTEAPSPGAKRTPVSSQEIELRAYQLFHHRGCVHGFDVEDWLKAEAELQKESTS